MHVSGHIAYSSSLLLSSTASAEPGSGLKTSPVANHHMALTRTMHETVVRYQLLGTLFFQTLYYVVMKLVLWEAIANAHYFDG